MLSILNKSPAGEAQAGLVEADAAWNRWCIGCLCDCPDRLSTNRQQSRKCDWYSPLLLGMIDLFDHRAIPLETSAQADSALGKHPILSLVVNTKSRVAQQINPVTSCSLST